MATIPLDGIGKAYATAFVAHGFLTLICFDKSRSSYPSGYFDTFHIPVKKLTELLEREVKGKLIYAEKNRR